MEDLEPWNLFTNDFVAEGDEYSNNDNDDIEKKDIDDNEDEKNGDSADEDDESAFLVPEVTMGGGGGDDNGEQSNGNDEDEPGEDDDTIFNFGLEPGKIAQERPKRSAMNSKELARSKQELESLINYDQAVVYICPACGSEFDTQEQWKRHMNGVHAFNTRHGLNFVQIDKLYHECMECYKRIAMHSMENLLKHKYTHLPYRCSKCKFCHRQYKYRQDLMVHLRTQHYDELIEVAKAAKDALDKQQDNNQIPRGLAIKEIKENAVDIFENTLGDNEPVTVRNELMDQDDSVFDASAEQSSNSFLLPAFLEDALSRGSSNNSEQQSNGSGGNAANEEQGLYEKQIQYICPKCGQEYGTQNQWHQHIINAHDYGTRRGLNFEEINSNQQARCIECEKIVPVNIIHHLQLHKFTHLPHKSWLRCKLCFQPFPGRPDILKHLMSQHRLSADNNSSMRDGNRGDNDDADDSQDIWDCDDNLLTEDQRAPSKKKKNEERDKFDQHIEYLCPTCGNEFREKKLWRKHIGHVHKLTSLEALNFKNINEREVKCLECGKIITNAYGIQNAQQHYFTHMPFKSFIRCRLCSKSYTDRKGLVKHLRGKHFGRLKIYEPPTTSLSGQKSLAPLKPVPSLYTQPPTSRHPNQLLSRALQRPLRNTDEPPFPKKQRPERYKEIVTRNDVVYEIEFLDEEDDLCDNNVGIVNAAEEDDDDVLLVPEISAINNGNRQSSFNGRERCADCGSIFSTVEALRAHIRKEHDFYEKPRGKNDPYAHSTANDSYNECTDEHSNDDALLMPASVEPVGGYNQSPKTNSAECHFTYLCPSCGVEHYTQMDWRRHINNVHNFDKRQYLNFRQLGQDRFQCTICNDIVTKSKLKTLQDHKFRHLPYKSYLKCKHCGTLYNHKPNMFGHLQVRHNIYVPRNNGNEDFAGDDCGSLATPTSRMSHPTNSSTPSRPTSGNNRLYGPSSLSAKPASSGSNSSSFAKPPGLKTVEDVITFHNAVDHATITYFCPSCNENFDSHVFWRKHIVEEHNLNSREGLNFRQIDEHHYLCLQCYKRVTVTHTKGAIGQLQSHKFRHLPYKSFKCLRCNGEFVRKQMFFKHLNRATNLCESPSVGENATTGQEREQVHKPETTLAISKNGDKKNSSQNVQFDDTLDPFETLDDGTNASLIMNQDAFVLVCPECAAEFDTQRNWREHINIEHNLGKRENLGFKRINPMLHKCLECGESVSGRKLRDLQIHRFKHMPYGPYIQCKFCKTGYSHIRNMQDHLRQKHPNVVQKHEEYAKMEEMRLYEESSLTDADSLGSSSVVNEAELDEDDDDVRVVTGDLDDDEQYLLG